MPAIGNREATITNKNCNDRDNPNVKNTLRETLASALVIGENDAVKGLAVDKELVCGMRTRVKFGVKKETIGFPIVAKANDINIGQIL